MTRSEPHVDIDFLIVFHTLAIAASTATMIWITGEPPSHWPLAVVWLGLVAALVQFKVNGSWWRPATLTLVASTAMLATGLRGS